MKSNNKQPAKQKNTSKQSRVPWQNLLIEVVSIIIGITLALAVNEWRESRSQQSQAEAALINIREEISANLKIMEFLHINNMATLSKMHEDQKPDGLGDHKFIPGIQLSETSWETMLNTGISAYVEYETILMLSESYSMQGVYKKTAIMMTEASMNMLAYASAQGVTPDNNHFQKQFIDYFDLLVEMEDLLIKSYQKNLEYL